jgi:hypothetical protein
MTLSITTLCHYAGCRVLLIITLNASGLSVLMQNVIILSVVTLNVIVPSAVIIGYRGTN